MADVAQCWVRFEDGKLTHSLLYKLADGYEPCRREELGDPEDTWKWDRGKPKDPWTLQWLLPLQHMGTEEAAIFTTDSIGGSGAVKSLIKEFNPRRNTGSLPIIALKSRSYTNDWGPTACASISCCRLDAARHDNQGISADCSGRRQRQRSEGDLRQGRCRGGRRSQEPRPG